ncbi:MAG: fimbrillin family protein [Bacteroidales bacterium]|nr:fimbrillin family protein [Bacteroidales bacterium]
MKRYTESAIILLAVLAFVGCSKSEEFQHNPDSALQIESVSGISPFALTTKAVITGNTLPDSDAATGIGIFVTASDGSAYDGHNKGYTNVNFANSGSGWSTATPVYLSDTQGKLYGYFPYNSNANDLRAIPVQSSLNGTDYLYAEPQTVSHSNKSVSLQMKHALSRLHLTIKKGANFTADAPLSKITLNSTAIDATGTMDITTGAITASKGADETGTVELPTDGTITAEGIEKDILLVPADNSNGKKGISISLMIAGKPAGITIPDENGLDIRSGIQNNVTLTIEDTGIKVSGVGVGAWGEGGSQQVQVSGHTVTVKLDEEQFPEVGNDVLLGSVKVENNNVIIEAFSKSQKKLECDLDGEASCTISRPWFFDYQTNLDRVIFLSHIFTVSDISTDVTATIGYPRPTEISVTLSNHTTYAGCTFKLSATVLPADAFNKNFTWSSSNASVATVDENGKVTAMAEGETDITATTEVGELVATCKTTVKPFTPSLPGEFSVGPAEDCKTVCFSRGNLKYTPEGDTWWFFNNQYEYGHTSEQLSLFTWGCQKGGDFVDWGSNIGDGNTWRTLTNDEWIFLLNSRTNASGKSGYATVCGVKGLILLPDVFTDPMKSKGSEAFAPLSAAPNDYPEFTDNEYTAGGNWEAMETAGAVFLPVAGYLYGDDQYQSESGKYWHSTAHKEKANEAYNTSFSSGFFYPSVSSNRSYRLSVRLVTDVK